MNNSIQLADISAFAGANLSHGGVYACTNADLASAHTMQELDDYLFGCPESDAEQRLRELLPHIEVGRLFEYQTVDGSVMTESDDSDLRAAEALFKRIKLDPKAKHQAKTLEKGLATVIDRSMIPVTSNLEREIRKKVKMLRNRLARIEYVRALTALNTAAVNTDTTWDAASDPDAELQDMVDQIGKPQDTVLFSRTAWSKRRDVYRAKDAANGVFAVHASYSLKDLADYVDVGRILKEDLPIQSGKKGVKKTTYSDVVLSYFGGEKSIDDAEEIDKLNPASIVRFWTPADQGSTDGRRWGVISYETERLVVVAVFHFSHIIVTNSKNVFKRTLV